MQTIDKLTLLVYNILKTNSVNLLALKYMLLYFYKNECDIVNKLKIDTILMTSINLINDKGCDSFSMRELAFQLECKPASLYNHVKSLEELKCMISIWFARRIKEVLENSINDKKTDQAFLSACLAYKNYIVDNYELYKIFISSHLSNNEAVKHAGIESFSPMYSLIVKYGLTQEQAIHYSRTLRAFMHGFIELTFNGFMSNSNYSQAQSYEIAILGYLKILKERDFII